MGYLAAIMPAHLEGDLVYYLFFFAGQGLYILKRCASAIRSKTNPIKTRRAFIAANWDILLIRSVVEIIFPYYPLRHFNLDVIAGWFNFNLPSWVPPQAHLGILGFFAAGFAADALLDWISQSEKLPQFVRNFIKEQVPQVPATLVAVVDTTTTVTPVDPNQPTKETHTSTPVMAPEPPKG